ncbi:MAG: Spy/CpxP family protein refolding chaperone [Chitinophagales bacterium]
MNNPSRNRNLIFIIAVLLLTNIAVLAYFLWIKQPVQKRGGGNPKIGIADRLKDSVGFSDEQVAQYEKLKDDQWTSLRPMFDEMRKAKDNFFKLLSDPNSSDSVIDRASDVIAQKQKALDVQTFNHFKKVRALCTPEQQAKYDSMIQRMFRKMGKPIRRNEKEKDEKTK